MTKIHRSEHHRGMDYITLDITGEDTATIESGPGGVIWVTINRVPLYYFIKHLRDAGLEIRDPEREERK